jgi:hypothetical protein
MESKYSLSCSQEPPLVIIFTGSLSHHHRTINSYLKKPGSQTVISKHSRHFSAKLTCSVRVMFLITVNFVLRVHSFALCREHVVVRVADFSISAPLCVTCTHFPRGLLVTDFQWLEFLILCDKSKVKYYFSRAPVDYLSNEVRTHTFF